MDERKLLSIDEIERINVELMQEYTERILRGEVDPLSEDLDAAKESSYAQG